ncbi:hypothetical protein L228DRAFT_282727 [Xylona heveae TC161]|uniref:Uncharacterized protein n=1 Tax=Xylona heveae (strain CBS 132557 / TC161) TaxID=1328760 RepID=A0A165GV32_XYLHT|nr:hypothetical protein L228DRAFT_282727 [Xylona heveae TC161]KZF22632.1 hypothetical protein L228DRAFT_282727 [Xylona heveae TC161]
MTIQLEASTICAENIALFSILHSFRNAGPVQSVPFPPSSNALDRVLACQDGYALSLDKERGLASILAFLAQTENDRNHIPAVCIEQSADLLNLNVFVAVNRTRCDDGDSILRNTVRCLDNLFLVLARVSDSKWLSNSLLDCANNPDRRDYPSIEKDIFAEVISMCSKRILQRLRFTSIVGESKKKPIKEVLKKTIECVKMIDTTRIPSRTLASTIDIFTRRSREVIKLINSWSGNQTEPRLGALVEGIHHLGQVETLGSMLDRIPNKDMSPAERKSLLNVVHKVSRYRTAAKFLYRTAKKVPLARQMKASAIKLPSEAFQSFSPSGYVPVLRTTLLRIDQKYIRDNALTQVLHFLDAPKGKAADQFSACVRGTMREAKIHAEIQLIAHCERRTSKIPPRVICASKDACFLCNSLIKLAGKLHTPRCHGRLYPGWRLPSLPQLKEIERMFNDVLQSCIKESLSTLLLRRQKTVFPLPNESTLLTLPMSETTKCSSVQKDMDRVRTPTPSLPRIFEESNRTAESAGRAMSSDQTVSDASGAGDTLQIRRLSTPDSLLSARQAPFQSPILSNGIDVYRTSSLHTAGRLELQVEIVTSSPDFGYTVEWLTDEDSRRVRESHRSSIINAESLDSEMSLSNLQSLYITAEGTTVKVEWHARIRSSAS